MDTPTQTWTYLARKPGSFYRQLFVKDRWIAARTLAVAATNPTDPQPPEELAAMFDIPLAAVREALAYWAMNPPEIRQDQEEELQRIRAMQAASLIPLEPSGPPPRYWRYLAPKRGSLYRQLFVKDRGVAARTLYGAYLCETMPRTPEEIATDWDLPLEAVLEAIAYCETDPPEIRQDWEEEEKSVQAYRIRYLASLPVGIHTNGSTS